MKVSFRIRRYLVALLWHWITPFMFGFIAAAFITIFGLTEVVHSISSAFDESLARTVHSCKAFLE